MKLSIIIVSYNTSRLTVDCIKSIFKYSPKFSFEVIVVDNGSTDGTVEEIRNMKCDVRIFQIENNLGFSRANNIGIKKAKGEYILLLNSDTIIINHVFDELVEFAESHPDVGVVAPKLLNPDKSLQASIFHFPTIQRAISQYWLRSSKMLDKYGLNTHEPTEVEAVVGAAFLITPQARKKAPFLNEKYFMYFEDLDYCRKIHNIGLKVYYLPCSYLVHLHGASGRGGVNKLLIDSSKKYFGTPLYFVYTFILWSGQKMQKLF